MSDADKASSPETPAPPLASEAPVSSPADAPVSPPSDVPDAPAPSDAPPSADVFQTEGDVPVSPLSPPGEGGEASLEQLEAQLKVMEEEQGKMAAEYEHVNESQRLEPHLAVIEEQFRQGFDDRFSAPAPRRARPTSFISRLDGDLDLIKVNRIFRDVSRELGDEWKGVFASLTSPYPPDIVEGELEKVERMQPIIRGYRSLNVWKELAGEDFNIRDLVDALRKNNMDDVADSALTIIESSGPEAPPAKTSKPVTRRKSDISSRSRMGVLDNRRMLLLAKKVGGDWEGLGQALGLPPEELTEIKEGPDSTTYQGAFKVLWAWRQTQPEIEHESSIAALKAALVQVNKQALADQLGSN